MNAKTLSLLISAACTLAGLLSGLAPTRAEAATAPLAARMVAGFEIGAPAPGASAAIEAAQG